LEYNKIVDKLSALAISVRGKQMCKDLEPLSDYFEICQGLEETGQALQFRMMAGQLPLGGIRDIAPSLKRADVGGVLSVEEIYGIGEFIYVCRKVASYAKSVERREALSVVDPAFEQITPMAALEAEINRAIANERDVADDASAKLSDIRRGIKVSHGRVNDALNSIIHSAAYKNMLQDAVITMRGGRFCVPIKQEYRGSFPGMVHDMSGSGATVFMEPMSVVELNNKIKEFEAEEKEEIRRILAMLSGRVAENSSQLAENFNALTYLDFIFAKAELALAMNATAPVFNNEGAIDIKKGRHPLLDTESVVPTDIYLGEDFTTLLITGPNTGGKTVALKTLGLFTLMGSAGLFIPAASGSRLAVFDNVFADIGDEQSIEQSLSTFSGHMTNIVQILEEMTLDSLVLFDELGAGTDPTEGAALAISIIRHLLARGIRTAVTTHYSELKIFALSTDGVENAAVEFNVETLRPTYRLLIGVPGKSNAFAIAKRLGLPEGIIASARDVLTGENIRFEDVITDLEISRKQVEIEEERAAGLRKEAERLAADLDNQKQRLERSKERVMEEAKKEARAVISKAKDEADGIIREMQKIKKDGLNFKEIEQGRQKLRESLSQLEETGVAIHPKLTLKEVDRPLKQGDEVYINSLGQRAVIISVNSAATEARVQFGAMETKLRMDDLRLEIGKKDKKREAGGIAAGAGAIVKSSKAMSVSAKLDLRGRLVEEALEELGKYLDDAYLAGMSKIEIVHGKGTGALRAAVQRELRGHPHIKSYRLGEFGEGDSGVTIVELH
jgi:DNA mismatch repair protein MutS2